VIYHVWSIKNEQAVCFTPSPYFLVATTNISQMRNILDRPTGYLSCHVTPSIWLGPRFLYSSDCSSITFSRFFRHNYQSFVIFQDTMIIFLFFYNFDPKIKFLKYVTNSNYCLLPCIDLKNVLYDSNIRESFLHVQTCIHTIDNKDDWLTRLRITATMNYFISFYEIRK
jgi:hypothetical protein